jgi:hypothetical protein
LRQYHATAYHRERVPPRFLLSALLILICAGLLAACSAEDERKVEDALTKAAAASKGLGMRVSTTGTVAVGGEDQPIASRAMIEAGGRRAKITTEIGGAAIEQYLDGSYLLMSADTFPSGGLAPPGTRFIRFDIDKVNRSVGLDATLRDLQQLDPSKTAALLAKVAEVKSAGKGSVRGVPVTRYRATVDLEKLVTALDTNGDGTQQLPDLLKDSELTIELSIDDDHLVRGYGMTGTIGPAQMNLRAEVTSYARDLKVDVPSGTGIYDITDDVTGALDDLNG